MTPESAAVALPARPSTARLAWEEFAQQYPAWMVLLLAASMLNTTLSNLGGPRWDLAWPTVFPYAMFVAFYALRAGDTPGIHRPRALLLAASAAGALLLLGTAVGRRPTPMDRQSLLHLYEVCNFLAFIPLGIHAWTHGRGTVGVFFGAGLLYGTALENGGIFMGYFAEMAYRLYLPGCVAPLATMLGWVMVIYACAFLTWQARRSFPRLRRSAVWSSVVFAMCGVLFDLQIDPIATASGCWTWDLRLPPFYLGVPIINYVAWFSALMPFGLGLFWVQDRHGIGEGAAWPRKAQVELVLAAPLCLGLATVMFFGSMAVLEGGLSGPTYQIIGDFGRGLMGMR